MKSGSMPVSSTNQNATKVSLKDLDKTPVDPNATPYADLWEKFQNCLEAFNQKYPEAAAIAEDEKAFAACHKSLTDIYEAGRKTEAMPENNLKEKKAKAFSGKAMYNKFRELIAKDKMPPIKGIKSAALMEDVLVPLLKSISELKVDGWISLLCFFATGTFIENLIAEAGELAKQCEAQLVKFKNPPNLNKASIDNLGFYTTKAKVTQSEPVLHTDNSLKN